MLGELTEPGVAELVPVEARRVRLTASCRDGDALPKVGNAGCIEDWRGQQVQVMHNGVLIEQGSYVGPWMTEIIRTLRGHCEPQKELVFAGILDRLRSNGVGRPTAIELGGFGFYYLLWLLKDFPEASVVAMDPDPGNLDVGRRNFALNARTGVFVHGVLGPDAGQLDLATLMTYGEMDRVDLVSCDAQGGEQHVFAQAEQLLRAGRVRFAVVSTHHHSISGDPLTHQNLLRFFTDLGAHVIAEHTVGESYSGDGLIAVSFDPRDRDLTVEVSRARAGDSLFGDLEHDLAAALERDRRHGARLAVVEQELAELQDRLARVQASPLFRWMARRQRSVR
jgi:hypothetical protein